MLMNRENSLLLLIDLQRKLLPAIHDTKSILQTSERLLRTARRLQVPVLATEHVPERIGRTHEDLNDQLAPEDIISKVHFSAALETAFLSRLQSSGRGQVIVCGTEAHVCVLQTVLTLREQGLEVFMVSDACGSRYPADHAAAVARARQAGVSIVTAEMVMFEWLRRADDPEFRKILTWMKSRHDG